MRAHMHQALKMRFPLPCPAVLRCSQPCPCARMSNCRWHCQCTPILYACARTHMHINQGVKRAVFSAVSVCVHANHPPLSAPTALSPPPSAPSLLAPGEKLPPPNADVAQFVEDTDEVDLAELGADAAWSGLCFRGDTRDIAGWGTSDWCEGFRVWGYGSGRGGGCRAGARGIG